jgi:hypothetical protein
MRAQINSRHPDGEILLTWLAAANPTAAKNCLALAVLKIL